MHSTSTPTSIQSLIFVRAPSNSTSSNPTSTKRNRDLTKSRPSPGPSYRSSKGQLLTSFLLCYTFNAQLTIIISYWYFLSFSFDPPKLAERILPSTSEPFLLSPWPSPKRQISPPLWFHPNLPNHGPKSPWWNVFKNRTLLFIQPLKGAWWITRAET